MEANVWKAIEVAYGEYWPIIDKSKLDMAGWLPLEEAHDILSEKKLEMEHKSNYVYFSKYEYKVRPKSLVGIELNNGWKAIPKSFELEIEEEKAYDLYDSENDSILWGVKGLFEVLAVTSCPSITHIREHIKQTPFYK